MGGNTSKSESIKFVSNHLQIESAEHIIGEKSVKDCWNFSLVVCQHEDSRYLIVQETAKHNFLWWLPGGRVEHGDSFYKTAIKETKEEGGIDIIPTKLLKIEQGYGGERMRFIYFATPSFPVSEYPKTIADEESTQSIWTTVNNFDEKPIEGRLRGNEPECWFNYCSLYPSFGIPIGAVHSIEVDESKLSTKEIETKRDSAVRRLPHKTITVVEIVLYSKKKKIIFFIKCNEVSFILYWKETI